VSNINTVNSKHAFGEMVAITSPAEAGLRYYSSYVLDDLIAFFQDGKNTST